VLVYRLLTYVSMYTHTPMYLENCDPDHEVFWTRAVADTR